MKTGSDTYIQWNMEYYDQDVIKSYSSYICHTLLEKIPRLTASPLPFRNFSILQILFLHLSRWFEYAIPYMHFSIYKYIRG